MELVVERVTGRRAHPPPPADVYLDACVRPSSG
jgi:hypothetical protein